MAQTTLEKVFEDVKTLTPDEQKQLRGLLDEWLAPENSRRNEVTRQLEARGLLRPRDPETPRVLSPFRPITVTGKPVSETIIEDRSE